MSDPAQTPGEAWFRSTTDAVRAIVKQVERCAQDDVLEVPFEDIDRMREAAEDLFIVIGRLKNARGLALERLYFAGTRGESRT